MTENSNTGSFAKSSRPLHLGAMLTASGAPDDERAWLNPAEPTDASINPEWYRQVAATAEEGALDFLFVADAVFVDPDGPPHYLSRFEPLTLLSYIAAATSHIGLVGTVSTSYQHPYNIARMMLSLDHLSGGRAGWNVVTSLSDRAARNFGLPAQIDHETRYAKASEAIDVVRGLWRSYDPKALPRDRGSGTYLDKSKLHALHHRGEFFDVAGPLNIESSPQGDPVIFQAGQSPQGLALAAGSADAVFVMPTSPQAALAYRKRLAQARPQKSASRPEPLILARVIVLVTDDDDDADTARSEYLDWHGATARMRERVSRATGRSVEEFATPISVAEVEQATAYEGTWLAEPMRQAVQDGAAMEDIVMSLMRQTQLIVAGTPGTVADELMSWGDAGAVDGFILQVSDREQFRRFVHDVVPQLRRRGGFRDSYPEQTTLRAVLGCNAE
ncbi:NtaA/DmoA family FMN-dependent monooxygenase [Rothia uropygioeca]|uniref:NtaA/DmoA family FMN-dependent monooxygenase n=1 Tax=Kocuria sp. 257 TaxID=2021970 RepID=UPI001010440B|nr:NtaA/DmoA family FMN-dependent monooxygenase [Kocuria sp. 257]